MCKRELSEQKKENSATESAGNVSVSWSAVHASDAFLSETGPAACSCCFLIKLLHAVNAASSCAMIVPTDLHLVEQGMVGGVLIGAGAGGRDGAGFTCSGALDCADCICIG